MKPADRREMKPKLVAFCYLFLVRCVKIHRIHGILSLFLSFFNRLRMQLISLTSAAPRGSVLAIIFTVYFWAQHISKQAAYGLLLLRTIRRDNWTHKLHLCSRLREVANYHTSYGGWLTKNLPGLACLWATMPNLYLYNAFKKPTRLDQNLYEFS